VNNAKSGDLVENVLNCYLSSISTSFRRSYFLAASAPLADAEIEVRPNNWTRKWA